MSKEIQPYQESPKRDFNPNNYIIQIPNKQKKSDYLPVAWRLVWFRTLCPTGTIETEIVQIDLDRETEEETYAWNSETRRSEMVVKRANGIAIFRATVKDGKGGIATATKTEKAASFGDFIEKAETGAVGRALAMLGYGTQFAEVEFDEGERVVDSPVERRNPSAQEQKAYQERKPIVEADKPASNGHDATGGPAQDDLKAALDRVKARCQFLQFSKQQWDLMLRDLKFKKVQSLADIEAMNTYLTKYEQQLNAAPAN